MEDEIIAPRAAKGPGAPREEFRIEIEIEIKINIGILGALGLLARNPGLHS